MALISVTRSRAAVAAAALLTGALLAGCTAQASEPTARASAAQDTSGSTASPSASPSPTPSAAPSSGSPSPTASPSATKKPKADRTPRAVVVIARGSNSARVRELQARLKQLGLFGQNPTGYYGDVTASAVRAFQTRNKLPASGTVTDKTWAKLRSVTRQPTHDAMYPPTANTVAKLDPRCMTGRVLCVSKTSRTLAWVVNGKVVSAMDVRFGSQYTPTREGTFSVFAKSRNHVSTIYHTPMPYAMFFSGGQAVHYSSDFAARGYAGASHGCVNVRDLGRISALFDQVRVGDKVVVYW
ncbi:L,D-transpeptidase family protein [Actinacidiphila glaucinigra]|uniref:Peptidoglycan-binding (PGRP) domain of peptidoglycan hydrolases-containing protein n=1 Tax=Actinacidiphila glaucinigra TaxID=235986 RepID=A0A239FBI3_9ACTN|nr:L,D-transpeptidase family protein [Actinacidiphila glaucinigra]SNS54091.1 Peptidoglycan-binding (PGRP) domain of peptidoglycan hydrolases-containing protein [Actinacidiphila glaucinigra]